MTKVIGVLGQLGILGTIVESGAVASSIPANALLNDDGSAIVNDDGSYILTGD